MTGDSKSTEKVEFQVSTANTTSNDYNMLTVSQVGIENRQTGGQEARVSGEHGQYNNYNVYVFCFMLASYQSPATDLGCLLSVRVNQQPQEQRYPYIRACICRDAIVNVK